MLEFLIDNIFVEFGEDWLVNKQSPFLWVLTAHHYLPVCFCNRMRLILYKDSWKQAKRIKKNLAQTIQFHIQIHR